MVLARPTCQTLHFGLLVGRVVGLGRFHISVWLSRSLLCGWLLLGTRVLLGGICMLQHPTRLVSSTCWGFSALWAVFWAPPADPTHICSVMVHSWCDGLAALVALLKQKWCSWLIGHGVVCWLVCWIICLVSVRAARWSTFQEHLTIVWVGCPTAPCMTLNLKVLLMVSMQPGHTWSGCVSCKLTAFFRLVGLSSSALLSSFMWWPLVGCFLGSVSV